jgi:hypothetical protein
MSLVLGPRRMSFVLGPGRMSLVLGPGRMSLVLGPGRMRLVLGPRRGRGAAPPGASRCSARTLAARSFPPRPPAYVLPPSFAVERLIVALPTPCFALTGHRNSICNVTSRNCRSPTVEPPADLPRPKVLRGETHPATVHSSAFHMSWVA